MAGTDPATRTMTAGTTILEASVTIAPTMSVDSDAIQNTNSVRMNVWRLHPSFLVKMNAMCASVRVTPISASRNAKPSETIAARIHMVSPDICLCRYFSYHRYVVAIADSLLLFQYFLSTLQDGSTIRT